MNIIINQSKDSRRFANEGSKEKIFFGKNFSMTMDYSSCHEREIWPFLKGSHISETGRVTPTKIGVHARDINPYLHEFFEPILINKNFPLLWTIS